MRLGAALLRVRVRRMAVGDTLAQAAVRRRAPAKELPMPTRFRYSQWDGTQDLPALDADDVLQSLSDDLLSFGDLQQALRNMYAARHPHARRRPHRRDARPAPAPAPAADASSWNASTSPPSSTTSSASSTRFSIWSATPLTIGWTRSARVPSLSSQPASRCPVTRVSRANRRDRWAINRKVRSPASKRASSSKPHR